MNEVPKLLQFHRFLLFVVQEPRSLNSGWQEEQTNSANSQGDQEFDDEEPSPGCESCGLSHRLDRIGEQPAKGARDTRSEVGCHDSLGCGLSRVDRREQVGKTLRETGFGSIQQHADSDGLAVVVDERSSKCADTPQAKRSSQSLLGAPSPDGKDPWKFKENGANTGQGVDVVELAALEVKILVETENSSVSKLQRWLALHYRAMSMAYVVSVQGGQDEEDDRDGQQIHVELSQSSCLLLWLDVDFRAATGLERRRSVNVGRGGLHLRFRLDFQLGVHLDELR